MTALLLTVCLAADPGILPADANGKPVNLDFESGTLRDWTSTGTAFANQPIEGDTVSKRRGDMKSNHQGKYWIGSYESHGDKPTGTLTSIAFKVTHPWASFLVSGGASNETRIELINEADGKIFFTATGDESENLTRVAVDVSQRIGTTIFIRIVDESSTGWGHINFDDFRFHNSKPDVPARSGPTANPYPYAGQNPIDAAKNMSVPKGFSVSLFAGEPDLHQPIAMCFDDRGRLWVVEAYCYPKRNPFPGPIIPDRKLGDKILILEDTNGDGTFDKKSTFIEGLNLVSGIAYSHGKLWIGAAPFLLTIPILDGDKAGEPTILLDGWGYEDTHETLNSFIWGPDGWLYGCHGVFTHSKVGKPGTPANERIRINAGVWRYHPQSHVFEVYAHGTSNPWGLDYNANGDFFVEACVIPHLWHIVPGGRYQRQAGQHFNLHSYSEIATIAKHRHYTGNQWNDRDRVSSDDLGGGHAHSGLICYQGGSWPQEYHGKLFMGNIHGHRINVDVVRPKGSSYEGDRNPDFLKSHDRTCIIVSLQVGPDGNLFFCDWSDKQVCHRNDPQIWDRTNGRIFKVSHDRAKPIFNFDLYTKSIDELVTLQRSDNEWMARHARRILSEKAPSLSLKSGGELSASAKVFLDSLLALLNDANERTRLRGLWLIHTCGGDEHIPFAKLIANDSNPSVRSWAISIGMSNYRVLHTSESFGSALLHAAENDTSPIVRRAIASQLARLSADDRGAPHREILLKALFRHQGDGDDPILPTLYWNALEPIASRNSIEHFEKAIELAKNATVSELLPWTTRRIAAVDHQDAVTVLVRELSKATQDSHRVALLDGLLLNLRGKSTVEKPADWDKAYASCTRSEVESVRTRLLSVAVVLGDSGAMQTMREMLTNSDLSTNRRSEALASLLSAKDPNLQPTLVKLLDDVAMREPALRALASYDQDQIANEILKRYSTWPSATKRNALATLTMRKSFASALMDAVANKQLPSTDLTAEIVRQVRLIKDPTLDKRIAEIWGSVRETATDRKKLINDWTRKLNTNLEPDLSQGRSVFAKICQQCHKLYGVGGQVGPEITGSNRADLAYLLENIFDPSAVIPKEYAATTLGLHDGRTVTGIVQKETPQSVTLVTANETMQISPKDIESRRPSDYSMMPDDLLKNLNETEIKNLIAYLRHTQQVPMKATKENAKDFFNGKDLSGWEMDETAKGLNVWTVENGEIVGKSDQGLKRNTFLTSQLEVTDFKLSMKIKLIPNSENSGIQIRSVRIENGEMRGPQCDAGKGWWGKLYEESGRGLLWKGDHEGFVKENDWNMYVIEAKRNTIRTWLNDQPCTNLTDEKIAKKGLIGLQVHSGKKIEVRFKEFKLEIIE
jgi:putative membrane-bound dehydrogenase-like protein